MRKRERERLGQTESKEELGSSVNKEKQKICTVYALL
jgi:hypothetical protein